MATKTEWSNLKLEHPNLENLQTKISCHEQPPNQPATTERHW